MTTKKIQRFNRSPLKTAVSAAAFLLATSTLSQAIADDASRDISIESQPLQSALLQLSRQTGVSVFAPSDLVGGKKAPSITGTLTTTDALSRLLSGTGLDFQKNDDGSYIITTSTDNDTEQLEEEKEEEVDEEIIVTGSAIRNVQPTSQVKVYTAEDITRLGVGSTEDFIRKLPQNFSGLNTFSSTETTAFRQGGSQDAVGSSAANLGGLGVDATLILINGKRTAQTALFEGGVVNLSNIPISAIERVEIIFDGASARYGSDAIGGVINFITKKNYAGAETSARYETGRNGSDTFRLNQLAGYNWGSGGITGTLSYQERKPVDTVKLGITSFDHTDRGGSDWNIRDPETSLGEREYSLTAAVFESSTLEEQCALFDIIIFPGACEAFGLDRFQASKGDLIGFLPADNDGTSWTEGDLSTNNLEIGQFIPRDRGVLSETKSINLSANQDISDSFNLYSEFTYTETKSTTRGEFSTLTTLLVPAENPFNNLGRDAFVEYAPWQETFSGDVPYQFTESKSTRTDFHIGFTYKLPFNDWEARFDIGYAEDKSDSFGLQPAFFAPNPVLRFTEAPGYAERYNRLIELLASADPDVALNFFGNGNNQSPFISDIYGESFSAQPKSATQSFEAQFDGDLFNTYGGEARMAIGVEYRKDERDYTSDFLRENNGGRISGSGFQLTREPKRDTASIYTELDIPLISESNSLPLIQSLQLNIGARWEEYGVKDAFSVDGVVNPGEVVFDSNGELLIPDDVIYNPTDDASFSHTSPRVGLNWALTSDLSIQASWGESFRAPNFTQLLGGGSSRLIRTVCVFDPDDPRSEDMRDNSLGQTCGIGVLNQANPDLNPEVATTTSIGFKWQPIDFPGLSVNMDFRKIDFKDRIASIQDSFSNIGLGQFLDLDDGSSEFVVRRDDGRVNYFINKTVNFAKRQSEVIDFDVSYEFSTDFGDFQARLIGVYNKKLEDQLSPDSPIENLVGTQNGPEDWRGQLSLSWSRDGSNLNIFTNYSGSYINTFVPLNVEIPDPLPSHKVDSYWTIDLTASHDFGDGFRIEFGSNNLTNNSAPFFNAPLAFDPRVYNPTGRNVYAEVKKSF